MLKKSMDGMTEVMPCYSSRKGNHFTLAKKETIYSFKEEAISKKLSIKR